MRSRVAVGGCGQNLACVGRSPSSRIVDSKCACRPVHWHSSKVRRSELDRESHGSCCLYFDMSISCAMASTSEKEIDFSARWTRHIMWKARRGQQHPVFEKLDSRGGFTGSLAPLEGCRLERRAASAETKKPPEQSSEHRDFLGVRMTARPSFRSEREQPGPRASTLVTSAVPPVFLRLESA